MSDLEYTVKDGIATAHLNRPEKKNALGEEMVRELARALREAQEWPSCNPPTTIGKQYRPTRKSARRNSKEAKNSGDKG